MTAHDPMTAQERALRDRLHAELVPPTTPDRLRLAVADLGEREMADARNRRARWGRGGFAALRGFRAGVAVVAVVAVAVVATVAIVNLSGRQSVATTPHPTLPPVTGSPLPSGAPLGTRVTISQGGWISPSVAWAEDFASNLHLTIDGGLTWSTHPGLADTGELSWLDAANGYYVWSAAAGGGQAVTAYFTHDGGLHWTGRAVGSFASVDGQDNALAIHFVDPQHGVAFGSSWDIVRPAASDQPATGMTPSDCRAWTTDDGGISWTPEIAPSCVAYSVAWSSPTMGTITYAYGSHNFAVTLDGGRTWTHGQIPGSAADTGVNAYLLTRAADGSLRLVTSSWPASWYGTLPTNVLVSTDSGASWSFGYEAAGVDGGRLRGVTALDAEHWLATVSGDVTAPTPVPATVLETFDAGRSWAQVATLGAIDIGDGVRWVDRLHGSVPGVDMGPCLAGGGSCGGGTLWLTNDGGQTWHGVPF